MFKKLGLASEQVCQLGRWKNAEACTAHYLRLNAAQEAGSLVEKMVHKVSHGHSAESDWPWTPGTEDQGGRDQEDEAQRPSEPTHTPKRFHFREVGDSPPRKGKQKAQSQDPFLAHLRVVEKLKHLEAFKKAWQEQHTKGGGENTPLEAQGGDGYPPLEASPLPPGGGSLCSH